MSVSATPSAAPPRRPARSPACTPGWQRSRSLRALARVDADAAALAADKRTPPKTRLDVPALVWTWTVSTCFWLTAAGVAR